MAELSRLVKRVGDQQKDMILDISQQLSRHNEMMYKALDKQTQMEAKIQSMEEALRKKGSVINYEKKLERVREMHHKNKLAL